MVTTHSARPGAARIIGRLSHSSLFWFLLALVGYLLAAGLMYDEQSLAPHYVHLADAILHGQLHLINTENLYDLLLFEDRAYAAGSPMPAFLLAPLVVVFNNEFSDILFTLVVAAVNVALVQHVYRRRWVTALFAFGTPHLYMAALGSIWLTAHVVAIQFSLLAVWAAQRRAWFWAGIWLACAGLARPTLLFGAAFFVTLIWLNQQQSSARYKAMALFGAPLLLGVAAHAIYNYARFGSPAEFGYQFTAGAENLTDAFARYSGFSPRFLPCNLFVSILNPPEINGWVPATLYDICDHLVAGVDLVDGSAPLLPNPLGMSIFLVTPAFLLLAMARRREPETIAGWIGLLAIMVPLWMYHNTGSLQFGYRYWMDAAAMWLLLLARNVLPPELSAPRFDVVLWRARNALLALSVAINVWGFLWLYRIFVGVSWLALWQGAPR
jgi:hypothetical protein